MPSYVISSETALCKLYWQSVLLTIWSVTWHWCLEIYTLLWGILEYFFTILTILDWKSFEDYQIVDSSLSSDILSICDYLTNTVQMKLYLFIDGSVIFTIMIKNNDSISEVYTMFFSFYNDWTPFPTDEKKIANLWLLFYYFHGKCSEGIHFLIPPALSIEAGTHHATYMNDLSYSIKKFHSNNFFSKTAALLEQIPYSRASAWVFPPNLRYASSPLYNPLPTDKASLYCYFHGKGSTFLCTYR